MPTILDLPLYNVLQKLSELKTMTIISVVRHCQSPVNSELEFEMESFGDTHETSIPSEDGKQSSDDSEYDECEEVWEESDESSSEECPELPNEVNRTCTIETAVLSWLLIFILHLQAKCCIPYTIPDQILTYSFSVYSANILL